jgi:hypothetical protein
VAQTCNLSYSRGRDLEDHGSKPSGTSSSRDPSQKRTGRVTQGVGPEFKPQNHKKNYIRQYLCPQGAFSPVEKDEFIIEDVINGIL